MSNQGEVMKRRDLIKGIGGGLAVAGLSACSGADPSGAAKKSAEAETHKWTMVTTWPKNFPGVGIGAERIARLITQNSGGRITVQVYAAGELVPAMEVMTAVSEGSAQLGHGASYYWKGKAPAAQFFAAVPFGMNAQEMNAWLYYGGGIELWREVYAPFGVLPHPGGNTGTQMGGWFNKEINSLEDLKGLKMRIPGLGGEILKRAGGIPVLLPGGEIFTALQTGTIDATEWIGPYNDLAFGLHQAAKFYYYPGWHEPGTVLECMVNKAAFEALPADLQGIVDSVISQVNSEMLAEYTARNAEALATLETEHGIVPRAFPNEVLKRLKELSVGVIADTIAADPLSAKVYESFSTFQKHVAAYHDVSERAFYKTRDL
jgi:TRAP-type mannitol/chloroaromatic compound transport system substrate-binding protein